MFTHLHVHTEFSMLDGLSRIGPLVLRAKELGMHSLAITDHGGMYGAIDFYRAAMSAGIKPIIGCEMYVSPGDRHSRNPQDKSPHHLTVLAKNIKGYLNLVKLVSKAHLEGFYYRPRVDRELLLQHHENLIVLSGCPSGEVPSLIAQGRTEEAKETALWYNELFPDYYLELMEHGGVPGLPVINKGLMQLHRELDIPVVATNDSHYVFREDAPLQDILICIHTNTNVNDDKRLKMVEDSYYLRSPEEMQGLYHEIPEAITNTERIAEMCDLKLDFSTLRLPEFNVPQGMTAEEHLAQKCWDGLRSRIADVTPELEERLTYELEVISQTQFANYFLVVWDIARFVRENDISFAVRGSAAASLTLYCLGVTDINPLSYRLVFERFLNVERKEMPDIDMDFQDDRREEVINYVVSKYGRDHVAQIITFGTLGARASIRDVGRALAMPYADVDRVARLIPFKLHITLDEAMGPDTELLEIYQADEGIRTLVDTARSLEGLTRHSSTHAAGVVISKDPLSDVLPLQRPAKGTEDSVAMTQYPMEPIAALGLLKMDLLGLVNLTILAKARKLIATTQGVEVELSKIPLDDAKTFELLSRGETVGVFQMEGTGMTRYIKDLKPTSLSDVAAMIALYRPGPMEHISRFIDAKHGRAEPNYPHPAFHDILEETYGVIVYQDQVLHIARTFAGYSLGEADIVRKAMGKKIPEIMAQEREKFIHGALEQGYSNQLAEEVFALVEPFAGYAFNKAHSVSYGLISYWTAYLKANYPTEYMVSLLNSHSSNMEKIAGAVAECQRLRIPVLPPNIGVGQAEFSIEDRDDGEQAIRFGMAAVKNVGTGVIHQMLEAREREEGFESLGHMCRVSDMSGLNRKALESLIKVGAFDDFGDRAALLSVTERILSLAQSEVRLKDSGQTTMFDLFGDSVSTPLQSISLPQIQTPWVEQRAWEEELLGVALSGSNPLNSLINANDSESIVFRSQIDVEMADARVVLAGQVATVTRRYTRDQRPFVIATLALMDGKIDVFVWENALEGTEELWEPGKLVTVVGTVRVRDSQVSISCTNASEYQATEESPVPTNSGHRARTAQETVSVSPVADSTMSAGADISESGVSPESEVQEIISDTAVQSAVPVEAGASRRLNLRIQETDEPASDRMLLDDVRRLLLEYRGIDEVNLEILTKGRVVILEWPLVRVDASSDLEQQLQELLGSTGHASVESVSP